jgi:hypothetical protein
MMMKLSNLNSIEAIHKRNHMLSNNMTRCFAKMPRAKSTANKDGGIMK